MEPEQKRNVVIFAILVLALGAVVYWQFGGGTGGGTAATSSAQSSNAPAPPQSVLIDASDIDIAKLVEQVKDVDFDYSTQRQSRNPMRPLVGLSDAPIVAQDISPTGDRTPRTQSDLQRLIFEASRKPVTGILYNEKNPLAVIDGETVGEGHQFEDGIVVHEIHVGRVVLRAGDTSVTRELKEP